jgi:hypothetical protein
MTDPRPEIPACINCAHHYGGFGVYADFCTLHRHEKTSYTRGAVASYPVICESAREDEKMCGPSAKDYVHRGPEPSPTLIERLKLFLKMFA